MKNEKKQQEMKNEQKTNMKSPLNSIVLGGTIEMTSMIFMGIGLAVCMFINSMWIKGIIVGVCAVFFSIPIIIRVMRSRNTVNVEKAISILKKKGYQPIVKEGEIRWVVNGKECILRIHSNCQVEISREYDIPPVEPVISGNEKAALETMKEVYLAKVSIRQNDAGHILAFSTESLCISGKELSTYIPICLKILDLAEDRQRNHITQIQSTYAKRECKKIGFRSQREETDK